MMFIMIWVIPIEEMNLLDLHLAVIKYHIQEDVEPDVYLVILVCISIYALWLLFNWIIYELCITLYLFLFIDILAESRVEKPFPLYVPRDEQFEESKANAFSTGRLKAVLHNLLPSMVASISKKHDIKGFSQLDSLYSEGVRLKIKLQDDLVKKLPLPTLVSRLHESSQSGGGLLKYDTPKILSSK